ncbi:EFR1 family ferrodoxin [Maribellus maritimus]|uniref:EFR1 family ferrodoxin n=1 Tax=Maribellus maritimus TaxID=2870838 RepID=UPI001EEB82E6|nr:EFR1 family ferrodoxin [Maribellus maritimus]MCG6185969.1 EFR1 family ferrodoxin [Maribellus maritimus]
MIDNLKIYYFTGTGNAQAVANWIAEYFSENKIKTEITKISPSLRIGADEVGENSLIGFCYPTHGFNAPPVVIDFLLRFPKQKNKVFLINTRAGMKLSKLFTPGMSGLAQLLPALILKLKGFQIIGMQPMDLPSNWISIHPGLREKVVESIFIRCKRITQNVAIKLITEKRFFKGLLSLPLDLAVSPISIGYYLFGRFALTKTYIAGNKCNGCRICEKQCPVQAIQMKNNRPFWTGKCESCMHCMNICPKKAIQTPHLFVAVVWWLIFSIIPLFFTSKLAPEDSFMHAHSNLVLWTTIFITGLPVVFFSYRILHLLLRYRFFNWLITYTSFTRLPFWRRYFAPNKY